MKKYREKPKNMSLPVTVTIRHFFIMLFATALCFIGMLLANRLSVAIYNSAVWTKVLFFAIASVFLGTFFSHYLRYQRNHRMVETFFNVIAIT